MGAELTFVLPREAAPSFPSLFSALDEAKVSLSASQIPVICPLPLPRLLSSKSDPHGQGRMGVESYGVSVTTMEEVNSDALLRLCS